MSTEQDERTQVQIAWTRAGELAPLYERYSSQTNPQPAYVRLKNDGTLTAYTSGEIGNATTADVWHNRTLRWQVAPELRGQAVAELLDELAPLAQRVLDGWTVEWDGNNHAGRLTEDARAAYDEIDARCADTLDEDESGRAAVWNPADWLQDYDWSVFSRLDGATWDTAAAEVENEARQDGVLLDGDTAEVLKQKALDALDAPDKGEVLPLAVLRLISADEFGGEITAETTDEQLEEYNYEWIDQARGLRDGLRKAQQAQQQQDTE